MKSRAIVLGALVMIVVVLIWNFVIFSPKGKDLTDAKRDAQSSQQIEAQLRAVLDRLQQIKKNGPEIAAQLDKLSAAVPLEPDLDGFILSANQIAVQSGIDWLSIAPSVVEAGTSGTSVIPLNIQIQGGFFQVLDYLNRLEDMDRLVIVDTINVSASAGGTTAAQSGPPKLSVTLTARMFTRAAPASATGSSPTPGATGSTSGTTSSTPPASGNSSGETSTSVQVN